MTVHFLIIGACFWSAWQILRRATWRRATVESPRAGHSEAPPESPTAKRLRLRMGSAVKRIELAQAGGWSPDDDVLLRDTVADELKRLEAEMAREKVTGGNLCS